MEKTDVLIVGGSAAGLMAAQTVKRRHGEKSVTIVRKASKTPVPCGIPYIYGTLSQVEKNLIPDENFIKQGIAMRVQEVTAIDRKEKRAELGDGTTLAYDKLILATGSRPAMPPIDGIDKENVFGILKEPEHLQKLRMCSGPPKRWWSSAAGSSAWKWPEQIAIMADGKVDVTLIEMLPNCLMLACEKEFCVDAEKELARLGVQVVTGAQVQSIAGNGRVEGVNLASGDTVAPMPWWWASGPCPTSTWPGRSASPLILAWESKWTPTCAPTIRTSSPPATAPPNSPFSTASRPPSAWRRWRAAKG